jgi:hypothetical protein
MLHCPLRFRVSLVCRSVAIKPIVLVLALLGAFLDPPAVWARDVA